MTACDVRLDFISRRGTRFFVPSEIDSISARSGVVSTACDVDLQ